MRALPRVGAMVALAVAVAAAAVLVLVAGRSPGGEPTGAASPSVLRSVSPPTDPGLDYRDPTAVCLRFADAVYRRDARADASPQAAYRRAMAYLTGELAGEVATQTDGRDSQWSTWRAHGAATDPTVIAAVADGDVQPADSAHQSYRVAEVRLTPVGADGWRGPAEQHFVLCTLRVDPQGWRVEGYQLADGPGTS